MAGKDELGRAGETVPDRGGEKGREDFLEQGVEKAGAPGLGGQSQTWITDEVNRREDQAARRPEIQREIFRTGGIVLGALIYSVGVNVFLRPLSLYSGGIMGFSQLFNTLLHSAGVKIPDITSVLYYLLNLPGLILAFRTMRRKFVVKTLVTVSLTTILLALIPIPSHPVLVDRIANCLIAGIMAGAGCGIALRMGSCTGGVDLIGMVILQTKGKASVGGINTIVNVVLYGICLLLFNVPTVIYSLIYSVICSMTCDHVHTQNINVQAMIVTKMEDISELEIEIMGQMHRGLTRWKAYGGYTGDEVTILMTVISKYEAAQLTNIVYGIDPRAFVMMEEGVSVMGHYLKKLT